MRPDSLPGDEVLLKNGITLNGTSVKVGGLSQATVNRNGKGPVHIDSFRLVDDGVRRFFVHRLLVDEVNANDDLAQKIVFELKHERTRRKTGPSIVGAFTGVEPYQFGRRTVTLSSKDGPIKIIQGITEIRPDYFHLKGLTHDWEYNLDTKTLSPELLLSLIEQSSDRSDPSECKAAFIFFLQANMLKQAQQELDHISEKFPELKDWAKVRNDLIQETKAISAINEVQRRRQAGQHELAYLIAKKAPMDEVSAEVFREAQDIVKEYEKFFQDRDDAKIMLGMLQAGLKKEQADRLRSMRATLTAELRFGTISRLNPFLRSQLDNTLTADQKLALAYSGWILGEANATLDLKEAILLWDARFLVLEFLRNRDDPFLDDELIEKLTELEYIGIERIVQMIPLLPPPSAGTTTQLGEVVEQKVKVAADEPPTNYSLMLPPNYSPHHSYPVLVVLRPSGRTHEQEIRWWAGDATRPGWAQRRGYIVIAPHYCDENATAYGGNTTAHQVVTKSIEDLRQRYRVNSDRIFLAGHGMGGDACFDIGMSRPDWFAGVIPITAECGKICNYYWENGPELGWYLVNGERDRNTADSNATLLNNMMRHGQNVIYCQYIHRGYESYHEEQERIFTWMQLQQRPQLSELKDWEVSTMRRSESSFQWLDAKGFSDHLFPKDIFSSRRGKKISARAALGKQGNVVYIQVPGTGATVWLSPELIDFDKRVQVRFNSKHQSRQFVQPSIKTLLSRLRDTGDRQRLYWAKIEM